MTENQPSFLSVSSGLLVSLSALLLLSLAAAPATAPSTRPTTRPAYQPQRLFGDTRLYSAHVHLSAQAWQTMQPTRGNRPSRPGLVPAGRQPLLNRIAQVLRFGAPPPPSTQPVAVKLPSTQPVTAKPTVKPIESEKLPPNPFGYEYTYVRGNLEFDGQTFKDVAIRFKGNSSYSYSSNSSKRPLKIDFNRFDKHQHIFGLTTLNFHVNAFDSSQMREPLSYAVFRACGVPAPRTATVLCYLTVEGKHDRECLGLYTLVEEVDKRFLETHFKTAKGLLLKPERTGGLTYLGEDWAAYGNYNAKTDATPQTSRRFIDFLKLIHQADDPTFRAQINSYLAMDEFLRFLAANVLLSNLDSFLFNGHNFYVYVHPDDNKIYFIPWDLNLSLGGYNSPGSGSDQMDLSVNHPYRAPNKLIERVLAIDEYRLAYHKHLQAFISTCYRPKTVHTQIDALEQTYRQAETLAKVAGKTMPPFYNPTGGLGGPKPDLKAFVLRRVESISAQLADQASGYIPGFRRGFLSVLQRPNRDGFHPLLVAYMGVADTDHNKKLSLDELKATTRSFFVQADDKKKGYLDEISLAEALERLTCISDPPPVPFGPAGRPAPPGRVAPRRPVPAPAPMPDASAAHLFARALVREADANRDWRITLDELLAAAQRAFKESDRDNDGQLTDPDMLQRLSRLDPNSPMTR